MPCGTGGESNPLNLELSRLLGVCCIDDGDSEIASVSGEGSRHVQGISGTAGIDVRLIATHGPFGRRLRRVAQDGDGQGSEVFAIRTNINPVVFNVASVEVMSRVEVPIVNAAIFRKSVCRNIS